MVGTGPRWMFSQHCTVVLEVGHMGSFGGGQLCSFELFLELFPISPPAYSATEEGTTCTNFTDEGEHCEQTELFLAPLPFV